MMKKASKPEVTKEYLLAKADGVKDCVKWLKNEIKAEQDCDKGYFFPSPNHEKIEYYTQAKIGLEKYAKKLRHEANELKD
ncbi:hypothetical protein [Rossellomorea marisflavi]|uniref:hypothetical protein n=1 Tax=Rossellomorea marisflavi TaxID=189381 RepID=UPI003FA02CDC